MHVQLSSHRGSVGRRLFVHTQVILPHVIHHSCSFVHMLYMRNAEEMQYRGDVQVLHSESIPQSDSLRSVNHKAGPQREHSLAPEVGLGVLYADVTQRKDKKG